MSGSNFCAGEETTGTPSSSAGSSTLSSPPAQAQSDGVQILSPGCGRIHGANCKPGIWPAQHAMAMQRALRRAGRAGGDRSSAPDRPAPVSATSKSGGCAATQIVRRILPRRIAAVDAITCSQRSAARRGSAASRSAPKRLVTIAAAPGILQPVFQRIGAEKQRQRQGNGAELVDRHMGDDRLEALRQQDRDAVARL